MTDPVIRFWMPRAEDFSGAVALVRATGARGDGQLRHFAIDGPMTIPQVSALLELIQYPWDGGDVLKITFDPERPVPPPEWEEEAEPWWAASFT